MKRYDFEQEIDGSWIEEDPDGEWVKWEDVKDAISMWETIINMNPFQLADFIQKLTNGKIKAEGRENA